MSTPWTVRRTIPPVDRPVTLDQVKLNLRLASLPMPLDAEILNAIDAATEQWEQDTDNPAIAATFLHAAFAFPVGPSAVQLSKRPVQSITEIAYTDQDGSPMVLDPSIYSLDQGRRQVYLQFEQAWPIAAVSNEAVQISYVAGYQSQSTVPRYVQRAIMLQVHKWFIDPGMEFTENSSHDIAYERLVMKHLATFHAA